MRPIFLDFLACPDCHSSTLHLQVTRYSNDGTEIEAGTLNCGGCGQTFLIKDGIPRMLPRDLRSTLEEIGSGEKEGTVRTRLGYDFHHGRQGSDKSAEKSDQRSHAANLELARKYFLDYLALDEAQVAGLKGSVVLDAGCGPGRYMAIAHEHGAREVVGLDLSEGGLLEARSLLKDSPGFHFVQGDITRPPFKPEVFDTIYSIGVLHHLENPDRGFQALKVLLAPDGQIWIWVYGLESMSLSYRISHLVWLRRVTAAWSLQEKYRLCQKLALIFRLFYRYPLRLAKKILPSGIYRRLSLNNEWEHYSQDDLVYAFFDRLQPTYTHYLRREQLEQYLADLKEVVVSNPQKRGWAARGRRT
jgi:SAM-dependent methyltransferase/uncharacterized protein YbaR (Trm112 family)